tara:strand:+ start:322 stop:771 length:450 start_codon:yes stop_codon:yes gene_type:complete
MYFVKYQIIVFIFYVYFSSSSYGQEYIIDYMGDLNKKEIVLEKSKFAIIESFYKWKDSNGQYGSGFCYGNINTEDGNINLYNICESVDSEGEKFWTEVKRTTGGSRGIGTIKYIQANGKYKKYLNNNCKYAVAWFNKNSFLLKQICKFN